MRTRTICLRTRCTGSVDGANARSGQREFEFPKVQDAFRNRAPSTVSSAVRPWKPHQRLEVRGQPSSIRCLSYASLLVEKKIALRGAPDFLRWKECLGGVIDSTHRMQRSCPACIRKEMKGDVAHPCHRIADPSLLGLVVRCFERPVVEQGSS